MKIHTAYLNFHTQKRKEIVLITNDVERIIRESSVKDGIVLVSSMHTTVSVIVNEEAGLYKDIMQWVEEAVPENPSYHHHQAGNNNGEAHLKNLLLHHQVIVPVTNGQIDSGPWQRIFYCEFDGQRSKRVIVKVMGE
jgi:secondary thiamine-phosphate synthase enzyme